MFNGLLPERGTRQYGTSAIGTDVEPGTAVTDALSAAGLDYDLHLVPVEARASIPNPHGGPALDYHVAGKKFDVVRGPTSGDPSVKRLGTVGDRYEFVQPSEFADILNPMADHWPLVNLGALAGGKRIYFQFAVDEFDIGPDEHRGMATIGDDHSGGGSVWFGYSLVKIVCENTYAMAYSGAKDRVDMSHTSGVDMLLRWRAEAELRIVEQREALVEQLNAMIRFQITSDQFNRLARAVFPDPTPGKHMRMVDDVAVGEWGSTADRQVRQSAEAEREQFEKELERAIAKRVELATVWNTLNDSGDGVPGTAYNAYNAVTEYADWGGRLFANGSSFESALFDGPRHDMKRQANEFLLSEMGLRG